MCGIAGSFDLRGNRPPDEEVVAQMTDMLSHRGPDDAGMLVSPPAVLGHRRLSILDLSTAGHQPMSTPDERLWITFNGEIYNFKELTADLEGLGHVFHTTCDTEVLLAAYAQWGADSLKRLNGMFAFAVWDRERQELFCARDRFGVKPMYYTVVDDRFRFASEIKALFVDEAVPRKPNDARVTDFLAFGITDHTSETMFEGIYQLPAGSFLVVGQGRNVPEPTRWYEPAPADLAGTTPVDALRERLVDAVALRLRSDVPVGTTVSGGLDSSAVTAIATMLRRKDGLEPAQTFSSRCDDPRIDEWPYIERVLEMTGAPNTDFYPREEDLLSNLDHVLWHMDEPFHSAAVYGHWKLSTLARASGVTVLLDGQGGDEALAGYEYLLYPGLFYTSLTRGRFGRAIREARFRSSVQGAPLLHSVKEAIKVFLPARIRARRPPAWLRSPSAPPLPDRSLADHHLYGLMTQPLPMYNHQLDRNTMAVALESRNPFLDYRVIECGLAFEPEDHVRQGYTKWTLREAVRSLLPGEVVDRKRKQGFATDESHWMRGRLGELMDDAFSSEQLASRPYFDQAALRAQLEAHRGGENHAAELWRAFIIERWLQLFVDPARLQAPERSAFSPTTSRSARDAVRRLEPMPERSAA
ncbi:asparagine synthase (glutamine-hydrolyzing) [Gaiella occulta]|uniref:asparagine synthase (glutamine-hydrolyzing) n=1 Tax=Gaiella occulta TaxID=1002870 RepID=A0A7M2YXI5_9ACTN|nr:asparagine synthase (glutamine-hydrolyzing) [Gaiella occulta]RDI74843.1 asparagine synthase (glutamine-hydrolyzing) [Gaiella occulta]